MSTYLIDPLVLDCVQHVLGRSADELDVGSSFLSNGGDSHKAILLRSALVARGYDVTRERILTDPCLGGLLTDIKVLATPSPDLSASLSSESEPRGEISRLTTPGSPPSTTSLPSEKACARGSPDHAAPRPPEGVDEYFQSTPEYDIPVFAADTAPEISHDAVDLLTEMQLSLIHETYNHCGANVIVYVEHHPTENVAALVSAWNIVIGFEAIFQGPWFTNILSAQEADMAQTSTGPESQPDWPGFSLDVTPCKGGDGKPVSKIIWKVHHAFVDAYSLRNFLSKVRDVASGRKAEPGTPFWEWALRLRHYQLENKERGDAFWSEVLRLHEGARGDILLPEPAAPHEQRQPAVEPVCFETETDMIEGAARQANVTPAAMFHAAWALVLATFADSDNIVFGAVVSGRNLPIAGSLDTIGPLINVLPLHVDLSRSATVSDLLTTLFRDLVALETHSWTTTKNGFTRMYESALSVELPLSEVECRAFDPLETHTTQRSQVPLSITVKELRSVEVTFHADRFSRHDITLVADCFKQALSSLCSPQTTIGDALHSLLLCSSHATLMRWGNCISGRTTRPSVTQDLVTLFEAAAQAYPDALALHRGGSTLSYRELDGTSSKVAHKLSGMTTPGDVVCVHSDRSINWICALWGVLKAGCTYCSLDPSLPQPLRDTLFRVAGASVLITSDDAQLLTCVPLTCSQVFSVESAGFRADGDTISHRTSARPWDAAYICFTSGSTGVPKPVVCSHAGLVAFQKDLAVRLNAAPGVKISQVMSVAFDGSIHEIFSALTYGATLVLPVGVDALEPLGEADSAMLTPSVARALDPGDYPNLKWVYFVGEPVPQAVADTWASCKTLYNMYGPTEATCGATIKRLLPGRPVTVGAPNPTTRVYILNSRRGLAQPGMVGRIHLAGVQVSYGYLNMPDQTAERFLQDSITGNGETMYDSGDLGYWRDGEVVCVGRNDRQVKLRGYRLDLNDLEIRIARDIQDVQAAAIAVRRGATDELVAMVQPASLNLAQLRSQLAHTLPRYAVPHYFAAVDEFPTTSAGKIDYRAIGSAEAVPEDSVTALRIVTDTERIVAAAFEATLHIQSTTGPIHRQRGFVELGGHSVDQIKLARHLTKTLGVTVSLKTVISNATIQALAHAIDKILLEADKTQVPEPSTEFLLDVTPIEQEWLVKSLVGGGTSAFNVVFLAAMSSEVDGRLLEHAFNAVLQRHKVLRSRYHTVRAIGRVKHRRSLATHHPRVQRLDRVNLWAEVNRPFKLDQEQPVRVLVTKDELLVVLSHVVADYTTLSILLHEASSIYRGRSLPSVDFAYPDPVLWGAPFSAELCNFWRAYLEQPPAQPDILRHAQRASYRGTSRVFALDDETSCKVLQHASSAGISLQQLALAAVALALDNSVGKEDGQGLDVILGAPFINRESTEHAESVGLFLQPLPVRVKHEWRDSSMESFVEAVHSATQAALAHGLPWHQLLEIMAVEADYPNHPLFDVMVTFHEPHMVAQLDMDVPGLVPCFTWSQGAKFKLMCEFMAVSETRIVVRLEYDDSCISSDQIVEFWGRIASFISGLVQRPEVEFMGTTTRDLGISHGVVLDENWALGKTMRVMGEC